MIKRCIAVIISILLIPLSLFSYSSEVQKIVDSLKEKEISDALEYLEKQINASQDVQDKRDLLIVSASIHENAGFYETAAKNYERAAALAASAASESSSSLLVQAARCALSFGDEQLADTYLASVAKNSVSQEIASKIKLYAVWSWLSKISDEESLHEPLVILSSYVDMKGMEAVQSSILLTLWYLTGNNTYSSRLVNEYSSSMETAVVQGKIQLMPSPFWYFVPRKTAVYESVPEEKTDRPPVQETYGSEAESIILHYQLGFFRNRENAQELIDRLTKAGFTPSIKEEVRQSGTTYYAVIVAENSAGDAGAKLKNAGFECYPVFK